MACQTLLYFKYAPLKEIQENINLENPNSFSVFTVYLETVVIKIKFLTTS